MSLKLQLKKYKYKSKTYKAKESNIISYYIILTNLI